MSNQYGPRIVTNGLVLCLDAANSKSYSGTGATWVDLNSSNNVTLYGSPSYVASNNGYFNFSSASSQYGLANSPGNLSQWTAEVVVRFTASYSTKVASIITGAFTSNKLNFSIGTNNAPTNYNISVGFFDGAWRSTTGISYPLNTWFHIVGSYNGSTIRQFTNSVQVDSLNYAGTPLSGGELRINRRWDSTVTSSNLLDTNIGVIRLYNRALSNIEIQQNFNTIKGRYRL